MNKQHILSEIKRTARENGGRPLGQGRFLKETGIKQTDWYGKYWSRWGDAVREAGFAPNKLQSGYGEEVLIDSYVRFIRELGRIPVAGELRLKRREDPYFPSHNVFGRLGSKGHLISKIAEYCRRHPGFDDVAKLCAEVPIKHELASTNELNPSEIGAVYLLKSGCHYKIGRTNSLGRREYELKIQLPEKAKTVHEIRTDDPLGIEAYWHTRFAAKRTNGEWFELDSADVQAFKRRKFM